MRREHFGVRFREVTSFVPAFGDDLFVGCSREIGGRETYRREGCSFVFAMKTGSEDDVYYYFPICTSQYPGGKWKECVVQDDN